MDSLVSRSAPDALGSIARFIGSHWAATGDTYRKALEYVPLAVNGTRELGSVSWADLDFAALSRIRELLASRFEPATVNRTLSAVRSLARQLARDGIISRERAAELGEVRSIAAEWSAHRVGRALTPDEQGQLLDAASREPDAPLLYQAIVVLALAGGLRRAEIAGFLSSDLGDFNASAGRLLVRFGKGRKQRVVFFTGRPLEILRLFVAGGGARYLSPDSVGRALARLERRAGVEHFTPHDCRRTVAGQLIESVDIATAAAVLGHASVRQTAAYDRRGEERVRAAALDPWKK